MKPAECHIGWEENKNQATLVAVVTINDKRKGVLVVSKREGELKDSLHKGVIEILRKVTKNLPVNSSFLWSVPYYDTLCFMIGDCFVRDINRTLSHFQHVKREDGNEDNEEIKRTISWSKVELIKENGWKNNQIIGTTFEDMEASVRKQKITNQGLFIPKVEWATLFQLPDKYVSFDLETTSKHASYARIIEIGAVKVEEGRVSTFHTYVNPQMKIPKVVRELSSIQQNDVDNAPPPWQAIRSFKQFVGGSMLVGHNVNYDITVLHNHCARFKIPFWEGEAYCTQQEAKKRLIGIEDTKLNTVCKALNINNPAPHQALADAESSRLVFEKLMGAEVLEPLSEEDEVKRGFV